jgi:hypothetical protein
MPEQIDVHEYRREQRKELTRERFEEWVAEDKRECRQIRKDADYDYTVPSDREIEIEFALCYNMPQLLPHVLKEEGSIRGALRRINRAIEDASHYDTDEYGMVSEPTFYKWVDKWANADETTDRNRRILKQFVR